MNKINQSRQNTQIDKKQSYAIKLMNNSRIMTTQNKNRTPAMRQRQKLLTGNSRRQKP